MLNRKHQIIKHPVLNCTGNITTRQGKDRKGPYHCSWLALSKIISFQTEWTLAKAMLMPQGRRKTSSTQIRGIPFDCSRVRHVTYLYYLYYLYYITYIDNGSNRTKWVFIPSILCCGKLHVREDISILVLCDKVIRPPKLILGLRLRKCTG